MDKLKSLRKSITAGNVSKASLYCKQLIEENVEPQVIIEEVLVPSMSELSTHYDSDKIYIPQLLLSSKALNECIRVLKLHSKSENTLNKNADIKVIIGTIKGDIHSIGKNIVSYLLQTYGYTVIDLGTNVSGEQFIKAVYEHHAQCVVMSAMLTSTLVHLKNAALAIKNEDFDEKPYILIGGALITEDFAKEIEVDYGFSAIDTANKVKKYFDRDS